MTGLEVAITFVSGIATLVAAVAVCVALVFAKQTVDESKLGRKELKAIVRELGSIGEQFGGVAARLTGIGGHVEEAANHLESSLGAARQTVGELERSRTEAQTAAKNITDHLAVIAIHLGAAVRAAQVAPLEVQLERYERINAGVQTIMLAPVTTPQQDEHVMMVRTAQASMRAALAVIPGANGSLEGPLPKCWALAHGRVDIVPDRSGMVRYPAPAAGEPGRTVVQVQGDIGGAEIEIEAEIRKVHERIGALTRPEDGNDG